MTIEAPLLPVLVRMEHEGVKIDVAALGEIGDTLEKRARELETRIQGHAKLPFNLNSPKQLGEVLFDQLQARRQAEEDRHRPVSDQRADAAVAARRASHH